MIVSTTHVHLDHDTCLESAILKGPTDAVRAFANTIQAERRVRFGAINLISAAGRRSSSLVAGSIGDARQST